MMPLSSRAFSLACFSAAAAAWLVLRRRRDDDNDERRQPSSDGGMLSRMNSRRKLLLKSRSLTALFNCEFASTEGGEKTTERPQWGRHPNNDSPFSPEQPMQIVLITDPGQDLDDEMALIMARHLISLNLIELRGVVANLTPSFARARLARGTLDLLGLHHVPVGIGTDGGDRDNKHTAEPFEESARSYATPVDSEAARALESGPRLLQRLYEEAGPKSLSLVVISSMKDAALFVRDNPILFAEKTREVVVMGGCKPIPTSDVDEDKGNDEDGGPKTDDPAKIELEPDTANNNTFDMAASCYLYRRVQELGVAFVVTTRYAAYAAKMPRCVYDDLALTGSSIGWRLRNSQRASIDGLWRRACSADPGVRKGLPDRCDRAWFIKTFCGGEDDPRRAGEDTVWDLVTGFMQYDTVALLAAVPSLREKYFSPLVLPPLASSTAASSTDIKDADGNGTRMLIGRTETDHNVRDPTALGSLLRTGYATGLACNHHAQPSIVLCLQLRWDNLADILLTCLMLRSLWDLRLASCLGVVISLDPDHNMAVEMATSEGRAKCGAANCSNNETNGSNDNDDNCGKGGTATQLSCRCRSLRDVAEDVCNTFHSIGMSHVNLHVVEGTTPEEHTKLATDALLSIYESAPPIGVTLVLTSTFTSVWPFADRHPELFRNKTVRVVHTGGALAQPSRLGGLGEGGDTDDDDVSATTTSSEKSGEMLLVPDPAAQNHRLDLTAARRFYHRAQSLSVPLVVLSRHVAKECCIPRNFFDVLQTHGGPVGRRIFHDERHSLLHLWRCASAPVGDERRCNLPPRCDRDWFAETFCAGQVAETEEDVWPSVKAINLYSPIALLAALPGATLKNYFETMPFTVRSATHLVIGLTAEIPPQNVKDHKILRSLVVQSLLSAALANESEFWQDPPTPIPLSLDDEPMLEAALKAAAERRGSLRDSDCDDNSVDEDTWYFTETARRRLFNWTVAMSCKNLLMPREKKRKVVRRRFSHPDSSRILCPMPEIESK